MDEILFPTQQKSNSLSDGDDVDLKFFQSGIGERKDSETSDPGNDADRDGKDVDGDNKNTDGDGDSGEPAHKKLKTKKELEEEERERMQ